MVYVIGEVVVVLSESDERVEGNPVWQNKSILALPLYYIVCGMDYLRTWVLDVSAVAADGRRPRRVEEKATNSKAGNRQT